MRRRFVFDEPKPLLRAIAEARLRFSGDVVATRRIVRTVAGNLPRTVAVFAALVLTACATPVEAVKDQVRQQAVGELVCDHASINVIQLRPLKKVQGQKQTIERGSFAAKGCGGYATFAVECIRGVCRIDREIDETLDVNKKKKTPYEAELAEESQ